MCLLCMIGIMCEESKMKILRWMDVQWGQPWQFWLSQKIRFCFHTISLSHNFTFTLFDLHVISLSNYFTFTQFHFNKISLSHNFTLTQFYFHIIPLSHYFTFTQYIYVTQLQFHLCKVLPTSISGRTKSQFGGWEWHWRRPRIPFHSRVQREADPYNDDDDHYDNDNNNNNRARGTVGLQTICHPQTCRELKSLTKSILMKKLML